MTRGQKVLGLLMENPEKFCRLLSPIGLRGLLSILMPPSMGRKAKPANN